MQSYSSRPAWLQPWPRQPWKNNNKKQKHHWMKMWLSEVLICLQWSSHYSNKNTWNDGIRVFNPTQSDPTTVFRPRPRTASVSLQKHVGKWQYLHVMKGHWKGSELFTRVLHDFQRMTEKFRECPRAFNLISIIEHSSSPRQRLRLWHMYKNKNTGVIPCGTVWILRKCCELHMLYQSP